MNVVFLTNKLINGGGERVLLRLVEEVVAKDGAPKILFVGKRKALYPNIQRELEDAGASVVHWMRPFACWGVLKRASTLHIYNLNSYAKVLLLWPIVRGRQLICHVHGSAEYANPLVRKLFCARWNPCHEVLFVSDASRVSYGIRRGRVIRNPVIFPARRVRKGSGLERKAKFLSVNRLVSVKRVRAQIEIIHVLSSEYEFGATLDIVGGGPEYKELQAEVKKLGIAGRVEFVGERSHAEVLAKYDDYDAFLATSAAEGLGISVIEALASGLLVFAAPIPSYREISDVAGGIRFIDPDKPQAAAGIMFDELQNRGLETAVLSELEKHFGYDAFSRQVSALYE